MPESRTVHAVDQAEKSESRHLPLVDLLIDTRAELTELVVRSGDEGARGHARRGSGRGLWAAVRAPGLARGRSRGHHDERRRPWRAQSPDPPSPCPRWKAGGVIANVRGHDPDRSAQPAHRRTNALGRRDASLRAQLGTAPDGDPESRHE